MMTMNIDKTNAIAQLQYRLSRYRAMGNGVECQNINREIERLKSEKGAN